MFELKTVALGFTKFKYITNYVQERKNKRENESVNYGRKVMGLNKDKTNLTTGKGAN